MKFASVIVLCLAIASRQTSAEPSILDAISSGIQGVANLETGAIDVASGIASGAANTAAGIATGAANVASGIATGAANAANSIAQGVIGAASGAGKTFFQTKASVLIGAINATQTIASTIRENVQNIANSATRRALNKAADVAEKIKEAGSDAFDQLQILNEKVQEANAEIDDKKQQTIDQWGSKAAEKLANSSDETQDQGQQIIDNVTLQQSENLKKCQDALVVRLEELQEKANTTGQALVEPMNELVQAINECSQSPSARCALGLQRKVLKLAPFPGKLAGLKLQIARTQVTGIAKNVCVNRALNQFSKAAAQADAKIDALVKADQKSSQQSSTSTSEAPSSTAEDTTPSSTTGEPWTSTTA